MPAPNALRDTLVLTLGGGQGERLYPLTRDRAKPAVPFGGLYRIIDFTLSNCLNSGMRRIYILTQYKSISLQRHLRLAWSLFQEEMGECLVSVPPQQRMSQHWYLGTADAVYQNIYTLQQERPQRVLILAGDHLYKMDYEKMILFHVEKGADVTVACVAVPKSEGSRFGIMEIDADSRIVAFEEKPASPKCMPGSADKCLASMGIYVFNTDILVQKVSEDAKQDTHHDFGRDILPRMIHTNGAYAVCFDDVAPSDRYWRDIGTIDAYWEASMDLLGPVPAFDLFDKTWPIRSYHTQRPPARSLGGSRIHDSLISVGATVHSAHVERSIVGPGVEIASGAEVTNCVLFDNVKVGPGCRLEHAIVDKQNIIPPNVEIGYEPDLDRRRFTVTDGGVTVVPKEVPACERFWRGEP